MNPLDPYSASAGRTERAHVRAAVWVLILATIGAFAGVLQNDFVGWDDDYNILRNNHFRGLGGEQLRWMFTTSFGGHYQPLTWLSFAIESQLLWGVNAAGFHFTNVLLHLAASVGFFFVAVRLLDSVTNPPLSPLGEGGGGEKATSPLQKGRRAASLLEQGDDSEGAASPLQKGAGAASLLGKGGDSVVLASPLNKGGPRGVDGVLLGATFAALLFAVHPLRVESVAWATERRDVLSGALLVFSALFYLRRQTAQPPVPDSSGGVLTDPQRGSRSVATGGVPTNVGTEPVDLVESIQPAPKGRRNVAVAALLRPFGAVFSFFDRSPRVPLRPPLGGLRSTRGYHPPPRWGGETQPKPSRNSPHQPELWLAASIGSYVLSLLSKAAGMTLPLVLLLLDLYPLRRGLRRAVVVEKVWYFVPGIAAAMVATWAQAGVGALRTLAEHPLSLRVAQAFYGVLFYLGKTVWPTNLVPLYEQRPEASCTEPVFVGCAIGVILLSVLAWRARRSRPAILVTWLAYLVLLSPMLGFAQSGPQVVADRYSYLPSMALMTLLGGAIARFWDLGRLRRFAVMGFGGLAVVLCIVATRAQVGIWKNTRTLWETTLLRRPDTPLARANYAVELNRLGEFAEARNQALLALDKLPGNRAAHAALARASLELGGLQAAEHHSRIALHIAEKIGRPDTATMLGLAIVETRLGRHGEAEQLYRGLIALEPDVAEWHFNLGSFFASQDRFSEARTLLEKTIELDPNRADAYLRLGVVYMNLADARRAVETWEAGLRRAPDDLDLRARLEAHRRGSPNRE